MKPLIAWMGFPDYRTKSMEPDRAWWSPWAKETGLGVQGHQDVESLQGRIPQTRKLWRQRTLKRCWGSPSSTSWSTYVCKETSQEPPERIRGNNIKLLYNTQAVPIRVESFIINRTSSRSFAKDFASVEGKTSPRLNAALVLPKKA